MGKIYKATLISAAVLSVVCAVVLGRGAYIAERDIITEGFVREAKAAAARVDKIFGAMTSVFDGEVPRMEAFLAERERTHEEITEYLQTRTRELSTSVNATYVDLYGCFNGQYACGNYWHPPTGFVPRTRPWYASAVKAKGETSITPPYVPADYSHLMVAVSRQLKHPDAVLSLDVQLSAFEPTAKESLVGKDGLEFFFTQDGAVLTAKDEHNARHDRMDLFRQLEESGSEGVVLSGDQYAFHCRADNGWRAVILQHRGNIEVPARWAVMLPVLWCMFGFFLVYLIVELVRYRVDFRGQSTANPLSRGNRVQLIAFVVATVAFSAFVLWAHRQVMRMEVDAAQTDAEKAVKAATDPVTAFIETARGATGYCSRHIARMIAAGADDAAVAAETKKLIGIYRSLPNRNYRNIFVARPDWYADSIGWTPPSDYRLAAKDFYRAAIANPNENVITQPYISVIDGVEELTITRSLQDGRGTVVGIDITVKTLQSLVRDFRLDGALCTMLVSPSGFIVDRRDYGTDFTGGDGDRDLQSIARQSLAEEGSFMYTDTSGRELRVISTPVSGGRAVVIGDDRMLNSSFSVYRGHVLGAIVFLFAVATIFVFLMLRRARHEHELKAALDRSESVRREAETMMALFDDLDSLFILDPDTGAYSIFLSGVSDIERDTVMKREGKCLYEDVPVMADTIIHKDDRAQFLAYYDPVNLRRIAETGVPQDIVNRWYVKGGMRYMRNKIFRREDGTGKVSLIIGVWDVTDAHDRVEREKRQLEAALDEAKDAKLRVEMLYEASHSVQWTYYIGDNDEVSAAVYDNFVRGKDKYDQPDKPMAWLDSVHPDERERVGACFMAAIRDHSGKTPYEASFRLLGPDGIYRWVKSVGRTLIHADGSRELFGMSTDITPQIEKERDRQKELEAEKSRFGIAKKALNAVQWMALVNAEDEVVGMSHDPETARFLNYNLGEVPHAWEEIVHPDDRLEAIVAFNAAIADHSCKTPYDVTYRMADRNGVYSWYRSIGKMHRNPDGTGELIGIHINVTDEYEARERYERGLEEAATAAELANESKTAFLFNMSHDIRTPMNAIQGFMDIARKNIGDQKRVLDCLEKAQSAGDLLLSLINSVLDMSRIESGKMRLNEIEADVYESFLGVETIMTEQARQKNIDISFTFGDIKDRYVYADCDRGTRIFVNIIANAIKYTPNGGKVEIRCEQLKNGVYRYIFADNGIGMSEEFQKHAFDQFSRERNSTTSGIQGTGLGLALVKSLVELMGGTIKCRSKQGEGSTFTVDLPFKVRSKSEEVRVADGKNSGTGKSTTLHSSLLTLNSSRRVLLVEDNALNREVGEYIMKENGFIVETAEDGLIAVQMVREKGLDAYDFILMDIQMPNMGGYEATRVLRKMGFKHPIIALSANAFAEDREASLAAGMDDHVAKPIKVDILMSVLAKFL